MTAHGIDHAGRGQGRSRRSHGQLTINGAKKHSSNRGCYGRCGTRCSPISISGTAAQRILSQLRYGLLQRSPLDGCSKAERFALPRACESSLAMVRTSAGEDQNFGRCGYTNLVSRHGTQQRMGALVLATRWTCACSRCAAGLQQPHCAGRCTHWKGLTCRGHEGKHCALVKGLNLPLFLAIITESARCFKCYVSNVANSAHIDAVPLMLPSKGYTCCHIGAHHPTLLTSEYVRVYHSNIVIATDCMSSLYNVRA